MNHISWDGIAARLLFCLFIVFATYNPSGRSYWHWLWAGEAGFWTRLAVGLVLLLTHLALFFTLRGVLGWKGLALVTVTFVALMLAAGPAPPRWCWSACSTPSASAGPSCTTVPPASPMWIP
jgi:hypothetical protein